MVFEFYDLKMFKGLPLTSSGWDVWDGSEPREGGQSSMNIDSQRQKRSRLGPVDGCAVKKSGNIKEAINQCHLVPRYGLHEKKRVGTTVSNLKTDRFVSKYLLKRKNL